MISKRGLSLRIRSTVSCTTGPWTSGAKNTFSLAFSIMHGNTHPSSDSPSLCCVDLSTTVLGKYDLSFVDSFEGFWTAPQPDRVNEIRCMMIMMVVGDGYDFCLVCCVLDPFPGLISCLEFSWMRHQPEPRS